MVSFWHKFSYSIDIYLNSFNSIFITPESLFYSLLESAVGKVIEWQMFALKEQIEYNQNNLSVATNSILN